MLDLTASVARRELDEVTETARRFVEAESDAKRYVLGRNQQALNCAKSARIDGIVDDFASEGERWNGYPVICADRLPTGAIVVNCSMSIRPLSAHARLAAIDGVQVIPYADVVRADPALPLPDFVESFRSDYARNHDKWHSLVNSLADETSFRVLNKVMQYRLTGDYRCMDGFSVRFNEQYFDPVVRLTDNEVFVDCGGYDGDTVIELRSRNPKYKAIYLFEPSPANFAKAKLRLQAFDNISLIPMGVSDVKGTLSFDPSAGSASCITNSGSATIDVVSIDEYIVVPVTYIKMDLEGWEFRALQGSKRHILDDHPKLAISVYHDARDFWRIPEYILGLRDDYDIYLRHYSEGWSETVMYFIPRARRVNRAGTSV
jgi:FkbM family methyltransferase